MAGVGLMHPDPNFWHGRRVLLTGHTGFKGGWLTLLLRQMGAQVTGFALPPESGPNLHDSARVDGGMTAILGDLRDAALVREVVAHARPEIVLHLAAQALVKQACAEPLETFSTNVMGTAHLLEAIRTQPGVRAVVVVTSDKVYDNVEWAWGYRESDRLGGREPYGASKAACELVVDAYRHAYWTNAGPRIATARAGNVIGGGDWAADRLVPDAVRAFAAGMPLVVRNPLSTRPWQHVLEPVAAYCLLAEALVRRSENAHAYNFGPAAADVVTVGEIADGLASRWGAGVGWQHDSAHHAYEARALEVDSALARRDLGWRPRWALDTALDHTVAWYRAHHAGHDMNSFTLSQIREFLDDHAAAGDGDGETIVPCLRRSA